MNRHYLIIILCAVFLLPTIARAQGDSLSKLKPESFTTKHSIKIDNKLINYTAVVGTLILKNEKDEPTASFGYTAYTKDGLIDKTKRPITFAYNGGPGSSSMWLHLGILGPRRVVVNDPFPNGAAPYKLEDNNYSMLDISDVVMLDPIGTGISRAVGKSQNKDFWGVDQDIKSVSQFIKNYIHENERWNSPKYLLGESYGTFRSAGVADYLQSRLGISVNGVILVSNVLDIRTLSYNPSDDISYIVNFPTYAATSWYHNKIPNKPASLENFLKEVREFSFGAYGTALLKGDQISASEKETILNKLVAYTGVSKEYWDKANLRVNQPQFAQEVLRNTGVMVGRLDSRHTGIIQNLLSEYANNDPQSSDISPAFISAFLNYYTTELKVSKDKVYNTNAYFFSDFKWDWKHARSQGIFGDAVSPTTSPDLLNAMSENPKMKVIVMNGIYDMATPFAGTEFTFDHLGLTKKLKENVIQKYYEAGHMMYTHEPSAIKFKKDLVDFFAITLE